MGGVRRGWLIPLVAAVALFSMNPDKAWAADAPEPATAAMVSVGAMAVPLTMAGLLWGTGRGKAEGLRFDIGLVALGVGSVLSPAAGQFYAGEVSDALVTMFLRAVTSAVMLTGLTLRLRGDSEQETLGVALATRQSGCLQRGERELEFRGRTAGRCAHQ